jgi:type IV secretion system protein VirD4
MMENNKIIYAVAGLFGLIFYSYAASLMYCLLAKIPLDTVNPITIWLIFGQPITDQIQSRLFVAFGAPAIALIFVGGQLYDSIYNNNGLFGKARWGNLRDIRKAKLLEKEGLIVGKHGGQYLMSDQPTHSIVVAPTRSGKGVGIVVPNLLAWKGSVICFDVKHENYRKTAGFRQAHGQKVFMWSPMDENLKSHRYNPLDAVSTNPHQQVSDLQVIARILIQDPPKSDPVWASEARALFVGLALYVLDSAAMPSTIGAINRLLGTEADLGDVCRHIVKKHPELTSAVKKSLMNFANKAAKERSGVKSSLNQAINLWDNPLIDAATSATDFRIEDLRKDKISIYVGVLTGQIETLTPLLRIFFEQIITKLSMKEPDESEPHKVLMLLDEFHMLGRIDSMTTAFTLLAGYNVRVMAVVQSLNWIDVTYDRDKRNGILSCCAHQIFFATNDLATAQYVSDSCGNQTVDAISRSKRKSMKYEAPTYNTSQRGTPLIAKHEMRDFNVNEQIILVEGSQPIKCKKIAYYKERAFKDREIEAPAVPELKILDNAIPYFDIQSDKYSNGQEKDPNQTEIDYNPPGDLTDDIPDIEPNSDEISAMERLSEDLK